MIDLRQAKKNDPVQKQQDKGLDQLENTPMDPPAAYEQPGRMANASFHEAIQYLMKEHQVCLEKLEQFEKALTAFKINGYKLDAQINQVFGDFFRFFDDQLLKHNEKEEKVLFQPLHDELIRAGEHSVGEHKMTAIDIMEDDHVKFIQLGALSFNLLGVGMRLQDEVSRNFVFDVAFENARELIELLKLHIYREDQTLFPLAQKLLDQQLLDIMFQKLEKY